MIKQGNITIMEVCLDHLKAGKFVEGEFGNYYALRHESCILCKTYRDFKLLDKKSCESCPLQKLSKEQEVASGCMSIIRHVSEAMWINGIEEVDASHEEIYIEHDGRVTETDAKAIFDAIIETFERIIEREKKKL